MNNPSFPPSLLQAIQKIECEGSFEWRKDNGYAFLSVSSELGFLSLLPALYAKGFRVRWTIRKKRFPAAYGTVADSVLMEMEEQLRGKKIKFTIEGVKMIYHVKKDSGRVFWLIAFMVKSEELVKIREKIGLEKRDNFNSHLTVLEYEVVDK